MRAMRLTCTKTGENVSAGLRSQRASKRTRSGPLVVGPDQIQNSTHPRGYKSLHSHPLGGEERGTMLKSKWSPTQPLGGFLTAMVMGKWDNEPKVPEIQRLGSFPVVGSADIGRLIKT